MRGVVTHASLTAVLDHYQSGDWRADLIAATGDIVQDDGPAAYRHFNDLLGNIGLPVYCVPGNHDNRDVMREHLSSSPFHYCDSFVSHNWLIVGIDSCIDGQAGGHVGGAELDRLDAEIQATSAEHVLVLLHHPPVSMGSAWLDSVGMANGREFLRRLRAAGKVRIALFGHVHQAYDKIKVGIRILGTPSTCAQFAPNHDEFTVDDRPPAYRRIALYADGRFDQQLVWAGTAI